MNPELESSPAAATHPSSLRRHGRKLAALFVWLLLLGGYHTYTPRKTRRRGEQAVREESCLWRAFGGVRVAVGADRCKSLVRKMQELRKVGRVASACKP